MIFEKFQGASLNRFTETMGNIPHLRLKVIYGSLTIPHLVHDTKCPVCAIKRKELIFRATYEKHRLRTRKTGYMRIIQPTAKSRETVGKTAILRTRILERHLFLGRYHPTNGHSRLDFVTKGCKQPRAISAHREAHTAYSIWVNVW